jgi:hypothetical protein
VAAKKDRKAIEKKLLERKFFGPYSAKEILQVGLISEINMSFNSYLSYFYCYQYYYYYLLLLLLLLLQQLLLLLLFILLSFLLLLLLLLLCPLIFL